MKKKALSVWMVFALSIACGTATAHDYWIRPNAFHLDGPAWVSFDFTAGHAPFIADENPLHEDYKLEVFRPDGAPADPPVVFSGMRRAAGEMRLAEVGTYLLSAVSTKAGYWSQMEDGEWRNLPKDQVQGQVKKSGKYVKSVKTFVSVRDTSDTVLSPRGYEIELVPVQHPGKVKAGQPFEVRVVHRGEPLAGTEVFALNEGFTPKEHYETPVKTKTDDKGVASVTFEQPGVWVVYCKHEVQTPDDPKADFANYRGYMMLDVVP